MASVRSQRSTAQKMIELVPGVSALARFVARIAAKRHGRVPTGLLALLPFAIAFDVIDAVDELFAGPIAMAINFVIETAFVLGVTGRAGYATIFSAIDVIPGVNLLPVATFTVLREIARAWGREEGASTGYRPDGPVIDV